MSKKDATAYAASLAATLMVAITVFQAGDGTHGAMPSDEYDGDEALVALEIDPWQCGAKAPHPPSGSRSSSAPVRGHGAEPKGPARERSRGGAGKASPLRQRERRRAHL